MSARLRRGRDRRTRVWRPDHEPRGSRRPGRSCRAWHRAGCRLPRRPSVRVHGHDAVIWMVRVATPADLEEVAGGVLEIDRLAEGTTLGMRDRAVEGHAALLGLFHDRIETLLGNREPVADARDPAVCFLYG